MVSISATVKYPKKCGYSKSCKDKFRSTIENQLSTYTANLSIVLTSAASQSVRLDMVRCRVVDSSPVPDQSTSGTPIQGIVEHNT